MPKLTYEETFQRRVKTKNADLRDFLQEAENVRSSMPPSYDRDTAMVEEMTVLLHGGKTLKGAHSESLDKVAEFLRRHAPDHPDTPRVEAAAREVSSYHYSRMR